MDISDEEYELANKRAEEMRRIVPFAINVRLEASSRRLVITLSAGDPLNVPISEIPELARAGEFQLSKIEISPTGYGIYFPELDVDLYVPGLLEEFGPRGANYKRCVE
jgi:hypothetical protein